MDSMKLGELADDVLHALEEIAEHATRKLCEDEFVSTNSFASGNTLTAVAAYQNLDKISQGNRDVLVALQHEPSIARLVLEASSGQQLVVYIARKNSGLALASGKKLASYNSPVGRLAELPMGDEHSVWIDNQKCSFSVIEKTSLFPRLKDGEWDSIGSQYRHIDLSVTRSIDSLRQQLLASGVEDGDDLDRMLELLATESGIQDGTNHQTRSAMGLRDQPILDQFQGEIFRLPLDSQLIIFGPPGTGKTTTLIKRLGQKIDTYSLDDDERRIATAFAQNIHHENSWLMFTPSDLLKHYLKEAFNREQVPASDARIKTWASYRSDIARNTLGILRSANSGKFTFRPELENLTAEVIADPRIWCDSFSSFHDQRLRNQLKEGVTIAKESASDDAIVLIDKLQQLATNIDTRALIDVYRELDSLEGDLKSGVDKSKSITDALFKRERNTLYNRDKQVFENLLLILAELQQDDDADDDSVFDEDDAEQLLKNSAGNIPSAIRAYQAAIRTLARNRYRKRSLPKGTRAAKIIEWLGDRIPSNAVLLEIGKHISFQNGMRRFLNASKRYVMDVPNSYQAFRKERSEDASYYRAQPMNSSHLSGSELDSIVLLMVRNCRSLLSQSFVARDINAPRFESIKNISSIFKNQIMVDEATDFSVLQLACMEAMTAHHSRSFFACGDFNQRITNSGIRSSEQISWISSRIQNKMINLVYRQSRALNAFSGELLSLFDGDVDAHGKIPDESNHNGVKPALLENASEDDAARWIAQRVIEVEQAVRLMPTIAVLVNSEEDVKPMAKRLSAYLESVNLKAVACEEGMALGDGSDVRVFDIQHIKGLEFEAVFFAGVDTLAEKKPDLFERFLYVGATRAATYLGMVCYGKLPTKMKQLSSSFVEHWGGHPSMS